MRLMTFDKESSKVYASFGDKLSPCFGLSQLFRLDGLFNHSKLIELEVPESEILYLVNEQKEIVVKDNFLSTVRKHRGDEWMAQLKEVKGEYVVAIHSLDPITRSCETIYFNEQLYPLWNGVFVINRQELPVTIARLQDDLGAKRVPTYFTLKEAVSCCNRAIRRNIISAIKYNGWDFDDIDSINLLGERI